MKVTAEQNAFEMEQRLSEVENRLIEMENVEAIRRVLAEYCRAVDSGDLNSLEALFTRTTLFTVMPWKVEVRGRDALMEFFRQFYEGDMKDDRHFCSNHVIRKGGEGYQTFCYFHAVAVWETQSIVEWGTYTDSLVCEEGSWKFQERHVNIHVLSSLEKGWAGPVKIIYGV